MGSREKKSAKNNERRKRSWRKLALGISFSLVLCSLTESKHPGSLTVTGTKGTEPVGPDSVQTTLGETADPQGQWTRPTVLEGGGVSSLVRSCWGWTLRDPPAADTENVQSCVLHEEVAFSCSSLFPLFPVPHVNPSTQQQRA